MQATIENGAGLKRTLAVVFDKDTVNKVTDKVVGELARQVRVNGFRKGHVPRSLIERNYWVDVVLRSIDKLSEENLVKALEETGATPVARPEVEIDETAVSSAYPKDSEWTVRYGFYTFPAEINPDFASIKVSQVRSSVSDADVDAMVERLRTQRGVWENVDDRVSESSDRLNIDFKGFVNDEPFEGGEAKGFSVTLDSGSMIPGFCEQLVGHRAGDEFTIEVTFPENYPAENLAGKAAKFEIRVNSVAVRSLPEVNEEFVKSFNIGDGTVETFRNELRANMEREQTRVSRTRNHNALFDALIAAAGNFDVPEPWIEDNRVNMCRSEQRNREMYGMKIKGKLEDDTSLYREEAENVTRVQWMAHELSRIFDLKEPSEESIDAELTLRAGAYEDPEEAKAEIRKEERLFATVKNAAIENEMVAKTLERVQVEYKDLSFTELVNTQY